jgi:hypothetical protein
LLKVAKLKYPQAAIEDLDSRSTRGLERSAVMSLALGEWVNAGHAVLITGATGAGKQGVKRSLLTENEGIPLSIAIDGASRHGMKLVQRTLKGIMKK